MDIIEKFKKKKLDKKELKTALKILKTFKKCESQQDWLCIPFDCWTMLEKYEQCLKEMIENRVEQQCTK